MRHELAILLVNFPAPGYENSCGRIVPIISKPDDGFWWINLYGNLVECAPEYLQIIGSAQQNEDAARVGKQQNCVETE